MIRDLAAVIICDGKVPSDKEQSFIVCLYKGKGDALERGNYRCLKLTADHESPRELVSINNSQFGLPPFLNLVFISVRYGNIETEQSKKMQRKYAMWPK